MAKKKKEKVPVVKGPENLSAAIRETIMRLGLGGGMAEEARKELKERGRKTDESVKKLSQKKKKGGK